MTLPAGMKMEVQLVDQYHPRANEWVISSGIGDSHPACEVTNQGEGALLAVRELVHPEFLTTLGENHA